MDLLSWVIFYLIVGILILIVSIFSDNILEGLTNVNTYLKNNLSIPEIVEIKPESGKKSILIENKQKYKIISNEYLPPFEDSMVRDYNLLIDNSYQDIIHTNKSDIVTFDNDALVDWHIL